jgi:hypothetical protein
VKKVLILHYSQAGQTQAAAQALAAGLGGLVDCKIHPLESEEPFPFPWGMRSFFRAFPRGYNGPLPKVKPISLEMNDFDLIFLCTPVWFLSIALPMAAFLRSGEVAKFKGKTVIPVLTCRNLWRSAFADLKRRLTELGASVPGPIVLCEKSPVWATFVTTPRWFLTGRKEPFWIFPAAGIAHQEFEQLTVKGRLLGEAFSAEKSVLPCLGANLDSPSLMWMDQIGRRFFVAWARVFAFVAPRQGVMQDAWLVLFRIQLVILILCVGPCTKIWEIICRRAEPSKG